MNVVIVNQYAITPDRAGITRHFMLARQLVDRGHAVTIVASSFDYLTHMETRGRVRPGEPVVESHDGVRFIWLYSPPYKGNSAGRVRNMLTFARGVAGGKWLKLCPTPDVIVGSSPPLLGAAGARWASRRVRVPFVLEVRDLWPLSLVELGNLAPHHPVVTILAAIERYLYRSSEAVITLLQGTIDHIHRNGGPGGEIHWVPNGVDLASSPCRPAEDRATFTVMYAGAHGLANALDAVVDAAAIVQSHDGGDRIHFRLIGDGPQKNRLRAQADARGIKNLSFEAPVGKDRIFDVLAEADAFTINMRATSLFRYGISFNKLYDYLAASRPILFAVDAPGNPVELATAGIVVSADNAAEIAAAIIQLAGTPIEERRRMGSNGRAYVEANHDIARLGATLERILESTLSRARPR